MIMKQIIISLIIFLAASMHLSAQIVKTGIDVLEENGFAQLNGKRIGLVTNPTGVDRYLNSTIDVLHLADGVELVALFGPEHGVRGNVHAGDKVEDGGKDLLTGIPIYSLYGKSRLPSAESLSGLDAIVYDIQDIGCRSYTYISTMGNVMKVAAVEGIEMIVLDRPNPLGGEKVEGPGVDDEYRSFVSQYDIPYVYGLTCGELATLLNEEGLLSVKDLQGQDSVVRCKLTVVKMEGWERWMNFGDTGLPWIPTSPHIPTPEAAYLYPATGILGELGVCSIGVGYTLPFQMIAFEGICAETLASALNALSLPGVIFRPIYANPFYGSLKGKEVAGVQIFIVDFDKLCLSEIQFRVLEVLKKLYPSISVFEKADSSRLQMFDKVCGTSEVRRQFSETYVFSVIEPLWTGDANAYKKSVKKYYQY